MSATHNQAIDQLLAENKELKERIADCEELLSAWLFWFDSTWQQNIRTLERTRKALGLEP